MDSAANLGALQRSLSPDADDKQILQALSYVDRLEHRGPADDLVAPLRERLTFLRPPRPWRFSRLLFTPLNPVLVSPDSWRPGSPRLPRSIITPLSALIRAALPHPAEAAEAMLAREPGATPENIEAAGALVWPPAGAILRQAAVPPDWQAKGLPIAAFRPLAAAVAFALEAALPLPALAAAATTGALSRGEVDAQLAARLAAAQSEGPVAWGVLLVLALQYVPAAGPTRLALQANADPVWQATAQSAASAAWRWIEYQPSAYADPADQLRRRIALLNLFSEDPGQFRRALALRAKLRVASARQLEIGLRDQITRPIRRMTDANLRDAGQIESLAATARVWRRFTSAARQLDGAERLDQLWHDAAADTPADRKWLLDMLKADE